MYRYLSNDGRIVIIASVHWMDSNNKKETKFREWLSALEAQIIELESGEFKESGTMIKTCIIIIDKQ